MVVTITVGESNAHVCNRSLAQHKTHVVAPFPVGGFLRPVVVLSLVQLRFAILTLKKGYPVKKQVKKGQKVWLIFRKDRRFSWPGEFWDLSMSRRVVKSLRRSLYEGQEFRVVRARIG